MKWKKYKNTRLISFESYWSSSDFQPEAGDIQRIIKLSKGSMAKICRLGLATLVYRDGKFQGCEEPYWDLGEFPEFMNVAFRFIFSAAKKFGSFSTREMQEYLYPEDMGCKYSVRSKVNPSHVTSSVQAFVSQWPGEPYEEYSDMKRVRNRVRDQLLDLSYMEVCSYNRSTKLWSYNKEEPWKQQSPLLPKI